MQLLQHARMRVFHFLSLPICLTFNWIRLKNFSCI